MKQTCATCRFGRFEMTKPRVPHRAPKIRRDLPGKCLYEVKWPTVPNCMGYEVANPTRYAIWPDEGKGCKCWEAQLTLTTVAITGNVA